MNFYHFFDIFELGFSDELSLTFVDAPELDFDFSLSKASLLGVGWRLSNGLFEDLVPGLSIESWRSLRSLFALLGLFLEKDFDIWKLLSRDFEETVSGSFSVLFVSDPLGSVFMKVSFSFPFPSPSVKVSID